MSFYNTVDQTNRTSIHSYRLPYRKNPKVLVEIYRVALDPTKDLGLITNDLGKFQLEGNALVDSTKPDNDLVFGKFGRMVYL